MNVDKRGSGDILKWLIIASGFFIRFWQLGKQSFWVDEIISLGMFKSPSSDISYFRKFLWDVHAPLYSLLLHFWSMVSQSEFWLRTPSALAGGISVFFLYKWLKETFNEKAALTGSLLLAISPFSLYYSQELRAYAMLNLFVILSLIAFRRFDIKPNLKSAATLGFVLALTCLIHTSALLLCIGLFVYSVAAGKLKGDFLRYGSGAVLIVVVILSPWIYREITYLQSIEIKNIASSSTGDKLRGDLTLNIWSYPYILYALASGYSFGPSLRELHTITSGFELIEDFWIELGVVYLFFGGVLINGYLKSRRFKLLLFFAVIPVCVIISLTIIVLYNIKVFNVRYLTVLFPFFIALLAAGLTLNSSKYNFVIIFLVIPMLISDFNYFTNDKYFRDDIRGAVEIIMENEMKGDIITLLGVNEGFDHYYSGENTNVRIFPLGSSLDTDIGKIIKIAGKADRVWLFKCREWARRTDHPATEVYSRRMKVVEEWKLPGIKLILFKKLPG